MRFRFGWPLAVLAVVLSTIVVTPRAEALVFVNSFGTQGDGPGQLETPLGITASPNGHIYVADTGNYRLQKFDSGGAFVGTIGGFGSTGLGDGEFNFPGDVAADFAGNLYVADTNNNRIQKFGSNDQFLTKWGSAGSLPGRFNQPVGVAAGPSGFVYVADSGNNRIQKFDAGGNFVLQWGAFGTGAGQFRSLAGVGIDFAGNVYVADSGNNRIQKFDSNGAFLTAWGTTGPGNGQFREPNDVAIESNGTVHVSDMNNHRIQSFTSTGAFVEKTGFQGSELGMFRSPSGVAIGSDDSVLVTDTFNHRVQVAGPGTAIIVTKDALPDHFQGFTFTTGGFSPSSFQLADDGNGVFRTRAFAVSPGSGYSVAEQVPSGWDLMSATCSDGSLVSNIDVEEGEQVHCTFVNRKRGWIAVVQNSQPNAAQDFSFTAGGDLSPSSFTLDDDGDNGNELSNSHTFTDVVPGDGYSIAQASAPGWGAAEVSCSDGSSPGNIDVSPGEFVTCTFVNTADNAGRIVVRKDAQPNTTGQFQFFAGSGMDPSEFFLEDDGDDGDAFRSSREFVVFPGSGYRVAEPVPSGWVLASSTCSDGSPVSNIDVSAGETVTCTFVNQKRGDIIVVEDSQPDDPQDFSYTAAGGVSPNSFVLDDDGSNTNGTFNTRTIGGVAPGSGYSLSQAPQAGWATTAACSDGSPITNIDVAPDETVTCTFINRLKSYPRPRGASPLRASLVPAYRQCTSPTAMHGAPLHHPSCPVAPASNYLTQGSPDSNGAGANGQAFILLKVRPQVAGPPDDADVRVIGTFADTRCRPATSASVCNGANSADGPDYSGEVQAALTAQLTDNFPIGTTVTFSFPVTLTCANSLATNIGGTCSVNTTFDAIVPGAVREGELAIWSLDAVKIMDGGPDGSVQTADNTLYMSQGIFVP